MTKNYTIDGIEFTFSDYGDSNAADIIVRDMQRDEYKLGNIDFKPGDVVLDIGAHVGIFSIYLKKKFPFLNIYSLEPFQRNFINLMDNCSSNKANINFRNMGMSTDGNQVQMICHIESNTGGASHCLEMYDSGEKETVITVTLDDFIVFHHLDKIKLLKIDTEGAEYDILLNCKSLDKIEHFRGEIHKNKFLAKKGFHPDMIYRKFANEIINGKAIFHTCEMAG